jgi:hypothetical protein
MAAGSVMLALTPSPLVTYSLEINLIEHCGDATHPIIPEKHLSISFLAYFFGLSLDL